MGHLMCLDEGTFFFPAHLKELHFNQWQTNMFKQSSHCKCIGFGYKGFPLVRIKQVLCLPECHRVPHCVHFSSTYISAQLMMSICYEATAVWLVLQWNCCSREGQLVSHQVWPTYTFQKVTALMVYLTSAQCKLFCIIPGKMPVVLFSTNYLKKRACLLLIGHCVIILCWMQCYFTEASHFSDNMLLSLGSVMKMILLYLEWKPNNTFWGILWFHHLNICNHGYLFYGKNYVSDRLLFN